MLQPVFDALARRDAAQAVALARAAVADQAVDPALAHYALGLALQLATEFDAAAQAFDQAIALKPEQTTFHLARAALALQQQDFAQAQSALGQAVVQNPNVLSTYLLGAQLALAQNDRGELERQLKLAQRLAPEHPMVLVLEANLARVAGDAQRAVVLLSRAAERAPGHPLVLSSLGLAHLANGHHAFAEQALRRALELQPSAVSLRWPLIEALRAQGRVAEQAEALERLLADRPDERRALALLAECRLQLGDAAGALDAIRRLLQAGALSAPELEALLQLLGQAGLAGEAIGLLDEQLARTPDQDILWQGRVFLASRMQTPDAVAALAQQWLEQLPNSPAALAAHAQSNEVMGQLEVAEASADRALALQPHLAVPLQVKLRAELRRDPSAALQRVQPLVDAGEAHALRRFGLVWQGFALDALQRYAEAAQSWRQVASEFPAQLPLPEIASHGSPGSSDGGAAPRLLWGPPGSAAMEIAHLLQTFGGVPVLGDRFGTQPRADGFGPSKAPGEGLPSLQQWRLLLDSNGVDSTRAVDWLPHWDARIDAGLGEARLVAVVADPRDLLLNWLVFGGPQDWVAPSAEAGAAWLAQALDLLAERAARLPEATCVIRNEALWQTPEAVAEQLQQFLALPQTPDVSTLPALRRGLGGVPLCFAPGHWKHYADAFAGAFATLAGVARRLGYDD